MTLPKGVIDPGPKNPDAMFVGWAPAPKVDRRFLLGALPLGLAGAGGGAWLIANELDDPGAGAWLTGATHEVAGVLVTDPYPMLRLADPSMPGGVRTVLIVAQGKCTSALQLDDQRGSPVIARGVLIQRKGRQMLEVPLFVDDWLSSTKMDMTAAQLRPPVKSLGAAQLSGAIMDTKCFFGVMRPGRGKTHKACASLCIRGGIPPSFWVRTKTGAEAVLLMTTADGGPMPMDILSLVADPVEAAGEIVQVGDLLQFRADVAAYRRV
jgi:hypothetical protein